VEDPTKLLDLAEAYGVLPLGLGMTQSGVAVLGWERMMAAAKRWMDDGEIY